MIAETCMVDCICVNPGLGDTTITSQSRWSTISPCIQLCSTWGCARIACGTSGVRRHERHCPKRNLRAAQQGHASEFLKELCCRWDSTTGALRPFRMAPAEITTRRAQATGIFLLISGRTSCSAISEGRSSKHVDTAHQPRKHPELVILL